MAAFTDIVSIISSMTCGAQLISPLLSIIPTELAPGRKFNIEGRRKQVRLRRAK